MSAVAWMLSRIWRQRPAGIFWAANLAAAVLFGLLHVPATAALVGITPLVVVRAIVLNGLVGVVAGWLYWRRGLESAMVAHFCADLVVHVLVAA
jgi:membrane protease YdiL (CAAX protease family)